MTVTMDAPMIIGSLLGVIAEMIVMGALAWRHFRRLESRNIELTEMTELQGDALREALNEIDRLRRSPKRGW